MNACYALGSAILLAAGLCAGDGMADEKDQFRKEAGRERGATRSVPHLWKRKDPARTSRH